MKILSRKRWLAVLTVAIIAIMALAISTAYGYGNIKVLPSASTGTTANKELQIASYDWADETKNPTKVKDGIVLFVGLDKDGKALPTADGESEIATFNKAWVPTVNTFDYAFAVMSDKAVEAEDGTNYRYTWYSPATRQMRYASGVDNEMNALILGTSISKQASSGVYKNQLKTLYSGDAGSLENLKKDWRSLVSSAKQTESKRLWRYIAGTNGDGASDRVRDYLGFTQKMKENINKQSEWTDEERNQGFLGYLDLLMTCYSSVDSDNAKVYWGNYIDRYISEGTTSGEGTPFNLTLISGTTLTLPANESIGAEKMVAVTGFSDIYSYAYQVQSIGDFSDREIADDATSSSGDLFGEDGFSKVLERIASVSTEALNRQPYEYPVTYKPIYEILNKAYKGRYNIATRQFKPTGGELAGRVHYAPYVTPNMEIYGADYIYAMPQSLNKSSASTLTGDFSINWADAESSYKSLDTSWSNISDSVQFNIRFKPITGEAGAWKNIASTYSEFRLVLMPERVYDKRTNVKTDGKETENGSNKEKYTPSANNGKVTVKLSREEFQSLVLGQMDYKGLYDIAPLNQSLQMGQMISLGYDLKAEFQWYENGIQKGSVEVPLSGYSQIEADTAKEREENAHTSTYLVTVYREEENTSDLVYYTEPTAYAEIKQGTVEMDGNGSKEDFEAMAGVPSTEYLYYASGGSEFVLEFELEYVEGEKGLRRYETKFYGTECEFKHNDQFKDIKAQGKADENGKTDNPTILKDKFVADEKGFDYENPIEVEDQIYNGYVPTGAASYSVDLVGHKLDPDGLDPVGNIEMQDSQPITATWTGTIANDTPQPSIVNIQNNNGKIPESGPGYPGDKGPESPNWNMQNYDRALKQAYQWAMAYEKTNETFTVMKWADSDNFQRVWKIGNAVITVQIDGANPTGAGTVSRSYSGGSYTTGNVIGTAQGTTIHGAMGTGWNFIMGNGASGSCSESGDPPVHVHGSLSGHKDSSVTKIGNKNYKITVTFPQSSNGTNKLTAYELDGPCSRHNMRAIGDAWVQYSQYDYVQFKAVRVYKIHRSYVNGMEDITFADYGAEGSNEALNHLMASGPLESYTKFKNKGSSNDPWVADWKDARQVISAKQQGERHNGTDTIVGAITQGDPNIFYNIALMNNESDSVVNKSYALEVRQQMLDRDGKEAPSKTLSEYPSGSGILRSTRNVWAGRVRYTYLPQLMDKVWMAEFSQRGDSTNLYAPEGSHDWNGLASFNENGFGSRSNKCDGVGFNDQRNGSMECRTHSTNNPVQVKGNGHKKPTVSIKQADLIFNRGSGGLSPSGFTTDIPSFSNGMLYSAYTIGANTTNVTDDEFWMQTTTNPDDRTSSTKAIDGTVETAGQYNNPDNGVVKSDYSTNTVDYVDYRTEEYYRFRFRRNETNKMFVISDMLILQTSSGDQPVMYHWKSQTKRNQQHYDYISADVDPKMASVDSQFTGTNITLKDNFKDAWYNQRAGDKDSTQDYYTATAVGWGVNNIGQDGAVNVGGYTGNYSDPDNKYSDTGLDLVTFNWADKWDGAQDEYQTRNTEGLETLFDHTGDVTDTSGTDVYAGYTRFYVDGFGWGSSFGSYLKGPAYLNFDGGSGGFYGCSAGNNKNYQARVKGEHTNASSYNGGALGRWHYGSIIDSTVRDAYKASPNVRLDASYHSPGSRDNRSGESRMSNVAGLRIVTDMIEQDPTNPNKEYDTGDAYQTYINILDYPAKDNGELLDGLGKPHTVSSGFNRSEFDNTLKSGLAGNLSKQKYHDRQVYAIDEDTNTKVNGLLVDATYSDRHSKVNNIVVQNPVSAQNALITHNETAEKAGWYTDTRTTDITTFTADSLEKKKAELEVCPEDETCEFKVLDCQYFKDNVMLSLDFNSENTELDTNGKGSIRNLAFTEGDKDKLEWVGTGDFKVVDKLVTKTPVKDDPNTSEREDLTETGEQRYTVNEVQPFGGFNGSFLEAVTSGKNGARMSIPLNKLGITEDNFRDHKLSVEFDLYMDSPKNSDGTAKPQTMILGFNGLGFYLPEVEDNGEQKLSFTTGNGVEKYTTKFSPYGKASHLRFEFSFDTDGVKNTRLYYGGKEITGFKVDGNSADITKELIFGNSTGYLNIGAWSKDDNYVSRFYLDNLKVVQRAGVAEHNEDCYEEVKVYNSSTMYLNTLPRIWETTQSATAKPYIFTVPETGKYKLQAWGASGGGNASQIKGSHGGLGGYASGYVSLEKGEKLMIYPGGKGETTIANPYEYLWVIDQGCGNAQSATQAASATYETVNINTLGYGIKYINSVTGAVSTPYQTGVWATNNPNASACASHSFSVAMYADGSTSGQMVKRISRPLMGYKTQSFGYTGGMQTFTAPVAGNYTLKTWGASGGGNTPTAESGKGLGGYAQGTVYLNAGQKINIFVGGQGSYVNAMGQGGGYNGGGHGGPAGFGGGGMTHISTTNNPATAQFSTGTSGSGSYDFGYTGGIQTFTVPADGTYTLETWGAQGGGWGNHGNAQGGYAHGQIYLTKGTVLYIGVGGKGQDSAYSGGTGYNGGGFSDRGSHSGGGATHIATSGGLLRSLSTNKDSVLIVAGGGGSNGYWAGGGVGGGLTGGNSTDRNGNWLQTGGGQDSSGSVGVRGGFGVGGDGAGRYSGAGGGGWYGGSGWTGGTSSSNAEPGGGGGSSYISRLTNAGTQSGVRADHGYARISYNINTNYSGGTWSPSGTLLVAGGGGGADNTDYSGSVKGGADDGSGGTGGGTNGGNTYINGVMQGNTGGTQTSGYKQGVGESATVVTDTGGAGGGWWGGKATNNNNGGAGGGSGYIGGVSNGSMQNGVQEGNGYAQITWKEPSTADTFAGAGFNGGGSGGPNGSGGGGATDIRRLSVGGKYVLSGNNRKLETTTYNGTTYVKVFEHNNSTGSYFGNEGEFLESNTPNKFSIMGRMDKYKTSGKYQFMLYYPENGKRNIWKQTKKPYDEFLADTENGGGKVGGYEPIEIQMTGDFWGGLAKSTATDYTYVDGSVSHGYWWYSIGSRQPHNGSYIPGGNATNVNKVQLWMACDKSLVDTDNADSSGTDTTAQEKMSDNGSITYGPYATAEPGVYQVDIYGTALSDCTFEVYSNRYVSNGSGVLVGDSALLGKKISPTHVTFYFILNDKFEAGNNGLEVRVNHNGVYGYSFESLYLSRLDDRLIVAGGGGGADDATSEALGASNDGSGGSGGGLVAGKARVNGKEVVAGQALTDNGVEAGSKLQAVVNTIKGAYGQWYAIGGVMSSGSGLGGGQDYGNALGYGEDVSYPTDTGGAGGGWWGGFVTNHPQGGAGGGSNHLSKSLDNGYQVGNNRLGNGKAIVQMVEPESSLGSTQLLSFSSTKGSKHSGTTKVASNVQKFVVPETGEYRLEVWGASGGDTRLVNTTTIVSGRGGKGAYTSAYVTLEKGTELYVYVGGQGNDNAPIASRTYGAGGWNGGGNGGTATYDEQYPESGAGGGGMTHISLSGSDNVDNNVFDRNSVLVVAGGGGGAGTPQSQSETAVLPIYSRGGEAGGEWGYSYSSYSLPGTQASTSGSGKARGADGYSETNSSSNKDGSGGNGAGWYGGGRLSAVPNTDAEGGAGGSSFININYKSSVIGTDGVIRDYPLVAGLMASGRETQPVPTALLSSKVGTQLGNTGGGYARITKVERTFNADSPTEVTEGEKPANVHVHTIECLLGPSRAYQYTGESPEAVENSGTNNNGKLEGAIRQYVAGDTSALRVLLGNTVTSKVGSSLAGYVNSDNIYGAIELIAKYINEIPEDSEVFMCGNYPLNDFDESKATYTIQKVLRCKEPHHTGGHYLTKKQAVEATGNPDAKSCYVPCLDDEKHKKSPTGAKVGASTVKGATYINTDEYFDLYFPTTGDFYESRDHGIGATQEVKGKGYTDNMDTKDWIRERYVKFDFDVLFYRTETGLWEQYSANEWIELPVKNGHDEGVKQNYDGDQYGVGNRNVTTEDGTTVSTEKEDWYSFYCTLNNNEKGSAQVTFEVEAINGPSSKGKYYARDKYPIFGMGEQTNKSQNFFKYDASADKPGQVYGNDYTLERQYDADDSGSGSWIDYPFMVWEQNSSGTWLLNTDSNRKNYGFKGGGSQYLTREQNRYNRVYGPDKNSSIDDNPATNHRNNNDNAEKYTNADRKSSLVSLHGAHLVRKTDLVGRVGNMLVTGTTDVRFLNFFKQAKVNGNYLINGVVKEVDSGIQRNYFSWHYNGVAGNRESLARDVRNRMVGKTENTDAGYNWLYDTWKTQYWKSARDGDEVEYTPENGAKADKGNPATEVVKIGSNGKTMESGPLALPVSSDKNNLKVYRDKEMLKPGYLINYELTTTGNYTNRLQVKPYYYALSLSDNNDYPKGTVVPVDVYMQADGEYKPINLWGYEDVDKTGKQRFPATGMEIFDYTLSLDWKNEQEERMITQRESELTSLVHNTIFESSNISDTGVEMSEGAQQNDEGYYYSAVKIPAGDFFKLGTAQLQRVENRARTFIGQSLTSYEKFVYDANKTSTTDSVDLSDTNFDDKFDLADYAYRAQRWHLKIGLPSSSVFTFYGRGDERIKPTDEVVAKMTGDNVSWERANDTDSTNAQRVQAMNVIKNGDYAILVTANIRALGPVWNIYYSQNENNGKATLNGSLYEFNTDFTEYTEPVGSADKSNSQVLIGIYSSKDTSTKDVDITGTH